MSTTVVFDPKRLLFPRLAGFYEWLGAVSVPLMRISAGLLLVTHGWPKIQAPFKNIAMVESLGFVPGAFWSPLLAGTEFFGGLLLALGLLTRPASLGVTIVLSVTIWLHAVVQGRGVAGAELSILWAMITFYFFAHGGGQLSVDRLLKREV